MSKFCIIDGYGFVFRAYHSLPPLTTKDGVPVGAIYGFANMLLKLIQKNNIEHVVVALDAGKKSFRNEIYPAYKANRPEAPEDLIPQFPIVRELISAFNIIPMEKVGFEADDIIATLAKKAVKQGYDVEIISSDKDLMQLVGGAVSMYDALKDVVIDSEKVKKKMGVEPHQVRDYLALVGDASDNIPGVKGVGAKTAQKLLEEFGSLEGILNNIENIQNPRQQKLMNEGLESAKLSYQLVGLNDNVEECDVEISKYHMDKEKLAKFLQEYGFKSLVSRVGAQEIINESNAKKEEKTTKITIENIADLQKLQNDLLRKGIIAVDSDENVLTVLDGTTLYSIPYNTQEDLFSNADTISKNIIAEFLLIIFANHSIKKLLFDAKPFLQQWNLNCDAVEDIAVMCYSIYTGYLDCTSLKAIAEHFSIQHESNAVMINRIYKALLDELLKEKSFSLYEYVDKPFIQCLIDLEKKGILLDANLLNELAIEFKKNADNLEGRIHDLCGEKFNIGSPKQLGEILFEKLQLPHGKKSKSGGYGTGADVLEKIAADGSQIANLILEWRQLTKLTSTYTNSLLEHLGKDGRIRTTFSAIKTSTGRLSSHNPNLQNIPIRSVQGNKIRKAFVAKEGCVLLSADYSQIELRLLAEMADITSLKEAFKKGDDIHTITAMEIFNTKEVTPELRRQAKMINFGILYGISSFGLAQRLGISSSEAKQHIENYFQRFPKVKQYMDDSIDFARKHGYVKTVIGRKCYVKDINSKHFAKRAFAERAAINAPLQGSNADIIKIAMINMPTEVKNCMVLQIHDELLFEVPKEKVNEYGAIIKKTMEEVVKMHLLVELKMGENWAESEKVLL